MPESTIPDASKRSKVFRWLLKTVIWLFVTILAIILLVVILIQIPVIQNIIRGKAQTFLAEKLQTRVEIGRINLKLNGGLSIENFFIAVPHRSDTLLYVGSLAVHVNPVPLFHKRVIFSSIELLDTRFTYVVTDTSGASNIDFIAFTDTTQKEKPEKASPWQIELRNIYLDNIDFTMSNKADSSLMHLLVGRFDMDLKRGNLGLMNFNADLVRLENTSLSLSTYNKLVVAQDSPVKKDSSSDPLKLFTIVKEIRLRNIKFSQSDSVTGSKSTYFLGQATIFPETVDIPNQIISLKTIQLSKSYIFMDSGNSITRNQESAAGPSVQLKNNSQKPSFLLRQASVSFDSIHLVNRSVHKDSALGYLSNISLLSFQLGTNNIQYSGDTWHADIGSVKFMDNRTKKNILISARAGSNGKEITLDNFNLNLGNSQVICHGNFALGDTTKGAIPDFRFIAQTISLYKSDILSYLPRNLARFNIPEQVLFKGNFASSQQHVKGNGDLESALGNFSFDAVLDHPTSRDFAAYKIIANISDFDAGKLLNDTSLGLITANVDVNGSGTNPETMTAKLALDVSSVFFMRNTYKDIRVDGRISGGKINATTRINDQAARLDVVLNGKINNNLPQVTLKTTIGYLNFRALGLMQDTLEISGYLSGSYKKYSETRFEATLDTSQITLVTPKNKITTNSKVAYYAGNDTIRGTFMNDFATISYQGNIGADKLPGLLNNYFSRYYSLKPDTLLETNNKYFNFKLALNDLSSVRDLLPVNLSVPFGGSVTAEFAENKLTADVKFRQILFNTLELDTFDVRAEGSDSALNFAIKASTFQNPAITVRDLDVRNTLDEGRHNFRVKFSNPVYKPWFDFGLTAHKDNQGFKISMQEPMIMNSIPWEVPADNEIAILPGAIRLHNAALRHQAKEIAIQNPDNNPDALKISFANLSLGFISQIIKGDTTALAGKLSGNATLFSLKAEKKKFAAELDIMDIRTGAYELGNFTLAASNQENPDRLALQAKLDNPYMALDADGYYGMQENVPSRISINARNLDLAGFATLLGPQIQDPKGRINASILFTGTTAEPRIEGSIGFDEIGFCSGDANAQYAINKQEIRLQGDRISFPSFRVNDGDGNPLIINGNVVFADLKNPSYRINIKTESFLAYNAYFNQQLDKENKIILTSDIEISGDIRSPVIKAQVKLDEGSKVYYELANQGGNFSEEGIIEFTGDIGVPEETVEDQPSFADNMNLTANITLEEGTPVTIMTDPAKGDILHVQTGGRLSLSQRAMQSPRLIGRIDITEGDYRMTLAGFKKNFTIQPKSTISWNGDIASPEFKLLAYYEIRTSPAPLFPAESQGGGISQLPNALPFRVDLNLTGTVDKPEIKFGISMAEEYQNSYGDVTAKIQQINSDPTEANKQAMFLVLFGTFDISRFTDPANLSLSSFSSMSNSGGTNALISRTLNQFAAQQIKFATLHFDLESYDNVGSSATAQASRTELDVNASRKFIDNRLDARVGGNIVLQGDEQEQDKEWYEKVTPIFNFQYLFNRPRTWGVKIFRQENYRGILEGKVGSLGAGVLFQKDYNNIKDLLQTPAKTNTQTQTQQISQK